MVDSLPCDLSNGSLRAKERSRAGTPGVLFGGVVVGGLGGNDSVRRIVEGSPLSDDATGIVGDFWSGDVRERIDSNSLAAFVFRAISGLVLVG